MNGSSCLPPHHDQRRCHRAAPGRNRRDQRPGERSAALACEPHRDVCEGGRQAWQRKQAAAGPDAMTGQARADPGAARQVPAMPTAGCRAFTASAANASSSSARGIPASYCRITAPPAAPTSVSEPGKFPDDPCYLQGRLQRCGLSWAGDGQQTGQAGAVPRRRRHRPPGDGDRAGARGAAMTGSVNPQD
jgi:hypothetical protein